MPGVLLIQAGGPIGDDSDGRIAIEKLEHEELPAVGGGAVLIRADVHGEAGGKQRLGRTGFKRGSGQDADRHQCAVQSQVSQDLRLAPEACQPIAIAGERVG